MVNHPYQLTENTQSQVPRCPAGMNLANSLVNSFLHASIDYLFKWLGCDQKGRERVIDADIVRKGFLVWDKLKYIYELWLRS